MPDVPRRLEPAASALLHERKQEVGILASSEASSGSGANRFVKTDDVALSRVPNKESVGG